MLKWLFSKKQSVSDTRPHHEESVPGNSSAFFQAINEKRREDPLIGAKIGAKEIFHRIAQGMKDERGVHAESLLCALGALAVISGRVSGQIHLVAIRGLCYGVTRMRGGSLARWLIMRLCVSGGSP